MTTTTTTKVPADALGYPVGGPEPKSREQLIAEQELRDEQSTQDERAAIDAAKAELQAQASSADPLV